MASAALIPSRVIVEDGFDFDAPEPSNDLPPSSHLARTRPMRDVTLTSEYRRLLNDMIENANERSNSSGLPVISSQIGASFWSAAEKDAMFHCLSVRGCVGLPSLCRAVGTKQEHEIQAYLSLLQENAVEHTENLPCPNGPTATLAPAACELSPSCEVALDLVADMLSARVEERAALLEQQNSGQDWLVDEAVAVRMEERYNNVLAEIENLVDGDGEASESKMPAGHTAKSNTSSLLRPAAFLKLSQNYFMNNGEEEALNWHHVHTVSDISKEPAMFQSALRDFENTVVHLTRRLVQASIYQAMTRLRAGDTSRPDWTPAAVVREVDVQSAISMLGVKSEWHQYWARLARRNQLAVYSESTKFNDGRSGTKNGYKLSYDEVESELDLGLQHRQQGEPEIEEYDIPDEDIDEYVGDSDQFTEEDDIEAEYIKENSEDESDSESEMRQQPPTKRRGPLSSESFCRTEAAYLDIVDKKLAKETESQLLSALYLEVPQGVDEVEDSTMPSYPRLVPPHERKRAEWRDCMEYVADWERGIGYPSENDFDIMNITGMAGRKRRKIIRDKVTKRLASPNE